jgi:hypothetical protein
MEKDSFVFYRSFSEAIDDLPEDEQLKVYRAIKEYALNEREIELTGMARSFFKLIKPQLAANNRRYKHGKTGGRPRAEQHPTDNQNVTKTEPMVIPTDNQNVTKTEPMVIPTDNQNVTKTEPNENVNVNVNENVNENVNVNAPDFVSFSENPSDENPPLESPVRPPGDDPPDDKPVETKEDAITVWNKARELWNELGLKPTCRDLTPRSTDIAEILRTVQFYSWAEIKDAIENFAWHRFQAGSEYRPPPPYQSLAGFLKTGVEKYYDTDSLEQQFREDRQ